MTGRPPVLHDLFYRWQPSRGDCAVNGDTEICIEEYRQAAKSFAVGSFRGEQPEPVDTLYYNHWPGPILQAVRCGRSTGVLTRDRVGA